MTLLQFLAVKPSRPGYNGAISLTFVRPWNDGEPKELMVGSRVAARRHSLKTMKGEIVTTRQKNPFVRVDKPLGVGNLNRFAKRMVHFDDRIKNRGGG